MDPKVAVVVINYNGKKYLDECYISLRNQTYKNFEIFLLDNSSSDDSVEYTRENYADVNVIKMDKNYGFAEGYNLAVARLEPRYQYVAMLNNDVKVDANWLKALVADMSEENVAVVGSKLLLYDRPEIINSAGVKLTFAGIGYDIGFKEIDSGRFNKRKYTGAACAGSILVRRKIFIDVGGFDGNYFLLGEDTDLCWRLLLYGYKIVYEPTSIVYHRVGESVGKRESPARIFYLQKNALATVFKNFGLLRLFLAVSIIAGYTLVRVIFYTCIFKLKNTQSLCTGTITFLRSIRYILKKRREIQQNRVITDRQLEEGNFIASPFESIREYIRVTRSWFKA